MFLPLPEPCAGGAWLIGLRRLRWSGRPVFSEAEQLAELDLVEPAVVLPIFIVITVRPVLLVYSTAHAGSSRIILCLGYLL